MGLVSQVRQRLYTAKKTQCQTIYKHLWLVRNSSRQTYATVQSLLQNCYDLSFEGFDQILRAHEITRPFPTYRNFFKKWINYNFKISSLFRVLRCHFSFRDSHNLGLQTNRLNRIIVVIVDASIVNYLVVQLSEISSVTALLLMMEPIGSSETSVNNYELTLGNNPEERRLYQVKFVQY